MKSTGQIRPSRPRVFVRGSSFLMFVLWGTCTYGQTDFTSSRLVSRPPILSEPQDSVTGRMRIPPLADGFGQPPQANNQIRSVIQVHPQRTQIAGLQDTPVTAKSFSPEQVAVGPIRQQQAEPIPAPVDSRRIAIQRATQPEGADTSSKYILRQTTADEQLELQLGLPQILTFRQPPLRTYIPESGVGIVAIRYLDPDSPHRVAIEPLSIGTTMLTMWFRDESSPDGEEPVSWRISVTDPGSTEPAIRARNSAYEAQLAALEREVNYAFPNSRVQLSYVGSQVLLRGKAKDVEESTQIARIVGASLPGDEEDLEEQVLQSVGEAGGLLTDQANGINTNLNQQAFGNGLSIDPNAIRDAGSLAGALRGDNATGVNAGRINNRVINLLEVAGVHQVMLKVTVAEVNRSASRAIGADLEIGSIGDAVRFFTTLGPTAGAGTLVLDQTDFDLAISALKQLNLARSLAEPTLTTLNGQPANFNVGGSFPVPVVTGQTATGLQGVNFQNFGIQLRFLPVVTDGDRIRLNLQASVSTRDEAGGAQVGATAVPGLNSRNFSNTVELREGQTLAVAGLVQSNLGSNSTRIPFVGDIPGLGRLFSNDGTSYDEQELVILVTPYLAAPVDEAQARQLALPGSDYFEPDDLEFFLKGRLTGHLAEDYRSPIRTDLQKMKAFRRCEQQLIIGQPGHSNGLLCPPAHTSSVVAGDPSHSNSELAPVPTAGRFFVNETQSFGGTR